MTAIHSLQLSFDPPVPTGLTEQIWARDASAWGPGEYDPAERLGWLDLPRTMPSELDDLGRFAEEVAGRVDRVILLGMGGSSLAPEMYARAFGSADGFPSLTVLDTTHPDRIRTVGEELDPDRTLFLVSSKSGTTLETLSLYRHFRSVVDDGAHFAAVTDPGSPLEDLATEEGFLSTFLNPPDIGGRYSALSLFGLVPAALMGLDVAALLEEAGRMADAVSPSTPDDENPGLLLGAALARLAGRGRDKATFSISPPLAAFGDWVEQLLAESTGKRGTGIVPIVGEPEVEPSRYGPDRVFVGVTLGNDPRRESRLATLAGAGHPVIRLRVPDPTGLGGQIFLWEFATAVAGAVLGINAFDQPDVETAKQATRRVLQDPAEAAWPEEDPDDLPGALRPGEHAALLVFAAPTPEHADLVRAGRRRLLEEAGVATSGAFGPRYLHSSGQLHKGGPKGLRALIVLDPSGRDLPIPGRDHGFARLIHAQAVGDAEALQQANRPVVQTTWERLSTWVDER